MNIVEEIKIAITTVSTFNEESIETCDTLVSIGIDSLRMVELIVTLEDKFGITFDDSDIDSNLLKTVNDIIELVNKYVLMAK